MLTESTSYKIQLLYKQYLNDITLFSEEDLNLLMKYYSEHPLFTDIKKTKGYTVFKKIITNIHLKSCERHDTMIKFDSSGNVFNILLFGNIKKRNLFKGIPKENSKKNSGKYLYCVYHCLSNCLFAEIDRHIYMKYLVSNVNDLYDKFLKKIRNFSFFSKLPEYQYNNLFLNYVEKKYGPHEIIFEEGDDIDGVYLIIKGKCVILKKKTNNLLLGNVNNNVSCFKNNYLTISNNDLTDIKTQENNPKLFHPIFAKNNKSNNILLTVGVGDIFGDLEINLNNNKREFSVKCGNYNKTKVWFFSLNIIESIINNFKELSEQKYDIIKTRFEYVNLIDKIKKENTIDKEEIKIDNVLYNSKNQNSNFKSLQLKMNLLTLKTSSNNLNSDKQFEKRNINKYNIPFLSSRNRTLRRKTKLINKNNFSTQSRPKLKILPYKSIKERNIISITKENNYIKKASPNMLPLKSIEIPKIERLNYLNPLDQKLFLKKINKKKKQGLVQCSNNETF